MGLATSEHIGEILIDPRNSNVVYVASQGPLFSEGGERGLYKTTDGGATWNARPTISKDTGVSDIVFDPRNPDVIFASAYQRRRHVGQMIGGGPEGGIFKTTNGGKTWTKLTKGLPTGDMGRVGLAIDGRKNPATRLRARRRQAAGVRLLPIRRRRESWARIGRMIGGRAPAADAGAAETRTLRRLPHRRRARPLGAASDGDRSWRAGRPRATRRLLQRRRSRSRPRKRKKKRKKRTGSAAARRPRQCADRRLLSRRRRAVLPRDLRGSVSSRLALVDERQRRAQHRRRQDLADDADRKHRRARRPSRDRVRSVRPEPHPARQRRRALRVVRRGRDVALLCEPAHHPVLPPLGRQRQAVLQRLRRHPGQLLLLRSVAQHEPPRRPHERLVHRRRRRRLPVAQRSRGSQHRLRVLAERRHLAPGPAHRHQPVDSSAGARRASAVAAATTRCPARSRRAAAATRARRVPQGRAGAPAPRQRRKARKADGRAAAEVEASARSRQLGRALHHQPALAAAPLLGDATTSTAPTIAATTGRVSAPISRAISIATRSRSWARSGRRTRSRATRRRRRSATS